MCISNSAEQFLHRQARPSVSLFDGSESLMYKLAFSSLLLLLSFSSLSSRYHCLRLQWGIGTHVLQSSICSGRSNPRPRNSHSLSVFPVLHVAFETVRSLYTNKRRQLERLGKCRQHLLFVRLSPPRALPLDSKPYTAMILYWSLSLRSLLAVTLTLLPVLT